MKVLIIGDKKHVFVYNLVKWIKKTNTKISEIDVVHRNRRDYKTDYFYDKVFSYESIPASLPFIRRFFGERLKNVFFKRKIKRLQKNYEIKHIHYIEHRLVENAEFLGDNITGKLVVSIWGSDFYRSNKENRKKIIPILLRADVITFENPQMLQEFHTYYLDEHQVDFKTLTITRFGLEPLDKLDQLTMTKEECKLALNIPKDRISICVGYNAFPGQQHIEILDSFAKVKHEILDKVCIILPLTYGGDAEYIEFIKRKIKDVGLEYVTLTSFLRDEEVAVLRRASDYFLNLQITDQLSGSMLEHLFAESIVVTGSWLPYKVLDDLGVMLHKVENVSDVGPYITRLLANGKQDTIIKFNKKVIFDFSYWGNCIDPWNKLYN